MNLFFDFFSEDSTTDNFCAESERILRHTASENREKFCIAVSGGSDSMALLILSHIFSQKHPGTKILCVTVNHNLRAEAVNEALFVKDFCNRLGVSHEILTWKNQVKNFNRNNIGKLENLAREARYKLISECCAKNNIELMLTGHTWNDQLETSQMREVMGSGTGGLAGMSQIRSVSKNLKILRPLLHFSREHLQNFLKNRGISWKNDPMNETDEFFRVSIRHKIQHYNENQFRKASQKIIDYGIRRHEIEEKAVNLLKTAEFSELGYASIEVNGFAVAIPEVQCEVLKRLIWNIGGKKYATSITPLLSERIFRKKINTIGRCLLRFKRNRLFIFREARNQVPIFRNSVMRGENLKFDERFNVKFQRKLENISIEPPQNFSFARNFFKKNFPEIPSDAIKTLPCVYQNNKMTAILAPVGMINIDRDFYGPDELFSCDFILKPELFDIFL